MKRKIKYTDDMGEMDGNLRPIRPGEFPELDELLAKNREKRKVTLELEVRAVEAFKHEAKSGKPATNG